MPANTTGAQDRSFESASSAVVDAVEELKAIIEDLDERLTEAKQTIETHEQTIAEQAEEIRDLKASLADAK